MNHPVSILFLFTSLPVGGAENLLLSVVKLLDRSLINPVVCCIKDKGEIGEEIERLGTPVITLDRLQKGGFDYRIIKDLQKIIYRHNIALVHTNLYHANLYGRIAAKLSKVPCVASVYNTYHGKPSHHKRLTNRMLAPLCDSIVVVSKEIQDDLVRWDHVPPQKIRIFPSAVDFSMSESTLSKSEAKQNLGISADKFVIGAIGRLEEQKGHKYLLNAIRSLLDAGQNIELVLVGDGKLRNDLEIQASDLKISSHVHFLGTRRDLGDIYRAMNVFVMPSLWDGLSLVLLSAMAAKVPIIATDVGNAGELLGANEYGILIPAADAQAITSTLTEFLDNPDSHSQMIARSYDMVLSRYHESTFVNSIIDLFSKIISAPLRKKEID
jgi:glycosyltransferase involved in cell wall biosynthesis